MIMRPSGLGIKTPLEIVHLYGDGAVSLGDGQPVVTEYPAPPMSAFELYEYAGFGRKKPVVPDHVTNADRYMIVRCVRNYP
jgi:hypothetical protein